MKSNAELDFEISAEDMEILKNFEKIKSYGHGKQDKNLIHLPRYSSFMIIHTFADWGNTGQNMAESLGITTVSTTKAHRKSG